MADDNKLCFVIGPIGDEGSQERAHADWLLMGIIRPVFEKDYPDWVLERADTIDTPGMVSSQIINRLHDVELVIADLSFHNANAFYEMSIRHKVAKPIIHMIREGDKIPFDVIPHRAIKFSIALPQDQESARDRLRAAIVEATKPEFEPDNPITHARGRAEFEEHASPAMRMLADEIATLRARLDDVEVIAQLAQQNSMRALGSPPEASWLAAFGTQEAPFTQLVPGAKPLVQPTPRTPWFLDQNDPMARKKE
jgi:hypothetical protein